MVTSATSATTTAATTGSTQMKQDLGLNSDDFLKLFIAQLQNQDPLSPQDPTEFLSQLAQISQVEQAYNTNTNLQSILAAQNSATGVNAVSFIGQIVKASGNTIVFDGTNSTTVAFNLSAATASGTVTISDSTGKVVRTGSLGTQSAGDVTVAWDGKDDSGTTLSAGEYTFAVTGATASGSTVTATTYTSGVVTGVSLANSTPTILIGTTSIPLANVISVGT